jgi:hypothetical protein
MKLGCPELKYKLKSGVVAPASPGRLAQIACVPEAVDKLTQASMKMFETARLERLTECAEPKFT